MFWDRPVEVAGRLIFGPLEASNFMATKWSTERNADFSTAAKSIMSALAGRSSPDHARELFEKALGSKVG
jgi:hypothetical protein